MERARMTVFAQWMKRATTAEQEALAKAAGTKRNYLYQIADGRRSVSADMAARIENAAREITRLSKKRLPVIKREYLCNACTVCPYRPAIRKIKKAVKILKVGSRADGDTQ